MEAPCVIFAISLLFMAVGILALSIRSSPHSNEAMRSSIKLCVSDSTAESVELPYTHNTTVELKARVLYNNENALTNGTVIVTKLQRHQLDLEPPVTSGMAYDTTLSWPAYILLGASPKHCTDGCTACALIASDERESLPIVPESDNVCNAKNVEKMIEGRILEPYEAESKCAIMLELNITDTTRFKMHALQGDIAIAHLHLLYTSCFLFTMLAVLLCCGLRRTSYVSVHRHVK